MTFFRSRIMLALIGLILIGGVSAAVAVATAPQSFRSALATTGQTKATPTATLAATATATRVVAPPVQPTAIPPASPTATPAASTSQLVDLHGTVASISASAGTFAMSVNGSSMTVETNGATQFTGDAKSLSALRTGWKVEVKGTTQANGPFIATLVNANSDN